MSAPEPPPRANQSASLPAAYFDELYGRATDGDPWNFARSAYEAAKYAATLARLPRPRYGSGLEVGCSIGVLTTQLAGRLDHLLAVDINARALALAQARCRDQPHVEFARHDLVESIPPGPFDLILLSEVAYYWSAADLTRIWQALAATLTGGGQMVLVHWRAPVPDYPQTGDQVHALAHTLANRSGLIHWGGGAETCYRIDIWERGGSSGVLGLTPKQPDQLPELSDRGSEGDRR